MASGRHGGPATLPVAATGSPQRQAAAPLPPGSLTHTPARRQARPTAAEGARQNGEAMASPGDPPPWPVAAVPSLPLPWRPPLELPSPRVALICWRIRPSPLPPKSFLGCGKSISPMLNRFDRRQIVEAAAGFNRPAANPVRRRGIVPPLVSNRGPCPVVGGLSVVLCCGDGRAHPMRPLLRAVKGAAAAGIRRRAALAKEGAHHKVWATAERQNRDERLKQEREIVDRMLQSERDELDCMIERKRVEMDSERMQSRAKMSRKMQEDEKMDSMKATTEPLLNDITPSHRQEEEDNPLPRRTVMEFNVHYRYKEPFSIKEQEKGRLGGWSRIVEPDKVEWDLMVFFLEDHGYKGNAKLYYLRPNSNDLVLMKGPTEVEQLLQDHEGMKICDLYIVIFDDSDKESSE